MGNTTFEKVYIVSDLHIGGSKGSYLMQDPEGLAKLIAEAEQAATQCSTAFIFNGDIFDFLAPDESSIQPSPFDPEGANLRLPKFWGTDSNSLGANPIGYFAPVLLALRSFLQKDSATLVMILGNHDIELAIPEVQQTLLDLLCGSNLDRSMVRGRVVFATDGAGFSFSIGSARVLCVHGNDQDPWNLVDHNALRKAKAVRNAGYPQTATVPANPGTRLVLEVMNEIKKNYAFVDLLKPEVEAVIPALIAFGARPDLRRVASLWARQALTGIGLRTGVTSKSTLGVGDPDSDLPVAIGGIDNKVSDQDLFEAIELLYNEGADPLSIVQTKQKLSVADVLLDRFTKRDPEKHLETTLKSVLAKDRSFDLNGPDEVFDRLVPHVSEDISLLVVGHTHLARHKIRPDGKHYINTGTWIGLISLHKTTLTHLNKTISQALEQLRTSKTLDDLKQLIFAPNNHLFLQKQPNRITGHLRGNQPDGQKLEYQFEVL